MCMCALIACISWLVEVYMQFDIECMPIHVGIFDLALLLSDLFKSWIAYHSFFEFQCLEENFHAKMGSRTDFS